ncbi:hypothetical protein BDR26DRAFT_872419 [Obelidium mucronatum]|nr:hypothetical protein BDR26DRAFT_872419 [Obelidium mucronatum]
MYLIRFFALMVLSILVPFCAAQSESLTPLTQSLDLVTSTQEPTTTTTTITTSTTSDSEVLPTTTTALVVIDDVPPPGTTTTPWSKTKASFEQTSTSAYPTTTGTSLIQSTITKAISASQTGLALGEGGATVSPVPGGNKGSTDASQPFTWDVLSIAGVVSVSFLIVLFIVVIFCI